MIIRTPSHRFRTEYDSRLVEEAVLLAIAGHADEPEFRRSRDRIYAIADNAERESRFDQLHGHWFLRLKLERPLATTLHEQPIVLSETRRCRVISAYTKKDEGVDLYGAPDLAPEGCDLGKSILVRLRAQTLLKPEELLAFLRHELMHIADMLDPQFVYQPQLPRSDAGPASDNLLRERYRILWDTTIDGRLFKKGWAREGIRERRLAEFRTAFTEYRENVNEKFSYWFDFPEHTHPELMAVAQQRASTGRCPLCQFPCLDLTTGRQNLSTRDIEEITQDFPDWTPERGLCLQCADLYRSRPLSKLAESALPKG